MNEKYIIGAVVGLAVGYVLFKQNVAAPTPPLPPRSIPTLPSKKAPLPALGHNYGIVGVGMHPDWYRRRGIPGY